MVTGFLERDLVGVYKDLFTYDKHLRNIFLTLTLS
jgi:hypothetical protein